MIKFEGDILLLNPYLWLFYYSSWILLMILEIAILTIKPNMNHEFEAVFKTAVDVIASVPGYISHNLQKCIEVDNQYLLLVKWQTLEAHTVGFRKSEQLRTWKKLMYCFYDSPPTIKHYSEV